MMHASDAVAIVGMAGRFPGAADTDAFWRLLCSGRDALREFSEAELLASGIERRWLSNQAYVRAGMVLDDIESFDADFFGMSAHEARVTDPQQRMLLECAWHALEDAARRADADSRVAVYVGARLSEYMLFHQTAPDLFGHVEPIPVEGFHRLLGNDKDYLATRIAYLLDLRGPAVTVQTACSTSLVAVHMACQSLLNGECDLALAGGASVRVPQIAGYLYSDGMIFSPDGHTRPFDARASGTIFGSGVGIVALRRLEDAVADDDRIYAVIRGSAVNNDGAGPKAAFTAPSIAGQSRVIAEALAVAEVEPASVSYVEAHGTGTAVGDPVEVAALARVFGPGSRCAIGAVKGNVGHLLQAAGVCGLMKVALMLHHRTLVPAANFEEPNPLIGFAGTPFFVNTELRKWNGAESLRAGVSAFGFGGTNAHVVLEQAPSRPPASQEDERARILPLSARSEAALTHLVAATADLLGNGESIRDVCHSAQATRASMPHRIAVVGASRDRIREQLATSTPREVLSAPPRIAFLFSGQGAQYAGMGSRLYETQTSFRESIGRSEEIFAPELERPLRELLFETTDAEVLARTDIAQPCLVALQIALVEMWRSWGIDAEVVVGHSLGELSAAWAAGLLSLEDVLRLAAIRGRLMHGTDRGAMVGVTGPVDEVERLLATLPVSIAAVNAPTQVVVSGRAESVDDVLAACGRRGFDAKVINDRYAFHSVAMDAVTGDLRSAASRIQMRPMRAQFISTLTGERLESDTDWSEYWCRQARERVMFAPAVRSAAAASDILIEVGPDAVLTALGRMADPGTDRVWLSSMRRGREENAHALTALSEVYAAGAEVEWNALHEAGSRRSPLPLYPFQRQRFWIERRAGGENRPQGEPAQTLHPLLGSPVPSPLAETQFQSRLTAEVAPFARDHWIYGSRPLPAVAHLEMMRAAAEEALNASGDVVVEQLLIERPLLLTEMPLAVQTVVSPSSEGSATVSIFSSDGSDATWTLHSSARLHRAHRREARLDLRSILERCRNEVTGEMIREQKRSRGAPLGPAFDAPRSALCGEGEALVTVILTPEEAADVGRYGAHPGVLDAVAQCADLTLQGGDPLHQTHLFLPTVLERAAFTGSLPARGLVHLRRRDGDSGEVYGIDASIAAEDGTVLVEIEGLFFKRATPESLRRSDDALSYEVGWSPLAPSGEELDWSGPWFVVGGDAALTAALAERVSRAGGTLVTETDGEMLASRMFGSKKARVVHLVSLSSAGQEPRERMRRACESALDVAQKLLAGQTDASLWLVTRGAQATGGETAPLDPFQAPLWGFGRVLQREQPSMSCRLIDLDPAIPVRSEDLVGAIAATAREYEIAVRGGVHYGMRLRRRHPASPRAPYRLEAGSERTIDSLHVVSCERRNPGAGEVEIEVYASGLNFRDVLNATGRIDGPLGYECSGVVARCGAGVEHLQPGASVMALAPHSLASHVIADARFVVPKPRNLSFPAAAGSVVAFVSAQYALMIRSRLGAGSRVLIHTAAGGVGQAAIQIARMAGATVFATASLAKREFVRAAGAEQVWDSRKTGFSTELLAATGGRGVDLVLNTLGPDFLDDNLAVLRSGTALVDLGHEAVVDLEAAAARAAASGVDFINFHIAADVATNHPDELQRVLAEIAGWLEEGALRALPYRNVPLSDVRDAFETMVRGAHVGKLVVTHAAAARAELTLDPHGTYLITGGVGALGPQFARWAIAQGARSLVLISRRPPSSEALDAVNAMTTGGVAVRCVQGDVSDPVALAASLDLIEAEMTPVRGVIHAAGLLDDAIVPQQSWSRFETVLQPKADGAWALHELLAARPLDLFVLVSSSAALLGNPGQANYAAANAFLDQLAHFRRQSGLRALSMNFGAWEGSGMAAALSGASRRRRAESGINGLEPVAALRALGTALAQDVVQIGVMDVDWRKFAAQFPEGTHRFDDLLAGTGGRSHAALPDHGTAPRTLEETIARVARHAAALAGTAGSIEVDLPLPDLGLDSLAVLLLRGRLVSDLGEMAALPVVRFLERRSVSQLASMIFDGGRPSESSPAPEVMASSPAGMEGTYLTQMRAGGGVPLLLVPAAGRTVLAMSALVESLETSRPVHGFNPAGLDGRSPPHRSVEEMAAAYLSELRAAYPAGPYVLGGICFGAHVAWEMATQLMAAGEDVERLILFDTGVPEPKGFVRSPMAVSRFYLERLRQHIQERSLRRSVADRARLLAGRARRFVHAMDDDGATGEVIDRILEAHTMARRSYRASAYPGRVVIVQSEELSRRRVAERWRLMIRGPVEVVTLPGTTHAELLGVEFAASLARALTGYLRAQEK